eukprot:CAMPEP_0178912392 /NCGR_PEP_ID=MMETSP0786-20121207/10235_1 /TAXON_ID=186022 /ORGANISM="Thalassionema frauenfeldii, Strain CCMP 1798" /LENGTH=244 /DNA_ID=CAMNT_0020584965 /DNA_START=194 /DNA_END=928 /DNA_ORIENTATION=+
MVKNSNSAPDAAVLTELKDVIKRQAAEIVKLKKTVAASNGKEAAVAPSSHHGGPAEDISSYVHQTFLQVAMTRVGWLSIFLASLSLTALIVNGFEHTLSRQIELAFFMPLLMGHGGNTGGQTVGTMLSGFSSGAISLKDAPRIIIKELCSGLTMGTFLGIGVALIAHYVMGISLQVSTVIMFALPLMSAIASTLGSTIPFLCLAVDLDPSVIAAPAMTSFVDVLGLFSYFVIAQQVFRIFGLEL